MLDYWNIQDRLSSFDRLDIQDMAENQHRDKMVDQDRLNSQDKPRIQNMQEWNIQDM